MLKDWVRNAACRLGYDVVKRGTGSRLVLNDFYDTLLKNRDVPLVLDVGANRGQFRDYLRNEIGFAGRIVSFEPNPADFAICEQRAQADGLWTIHPWAVGDANAPLILNVAADTVFTSAQKPNDQQIALPGNVTVHKIEAECRTIDWIVGELGLPVVGAHLKSDTQGFDLNVLRGAKCSLPLLGSFQVELSVVPIYAGLPPMTEALAEIYGYGFDLAALAPVTIRGGKVIEFDCAMINPRVPEAPAG